MSEEDIKTLDAIVAITQDNWALIRDMKDIEQKVEKDNGNGKRKKRRDIN